MSTQLCLKHSHVTNLGVRCHFCAADERKLVNRNHTDSLDALDAARRTAALVCDVLNRDSSRISPGQWMLVEQQMGRVYVDTVTGKKYAVADYLKEQS